MGSRTNIARAVAVIAVLAVGALACSDDGGETSTEADESTTTVESTTTGGEGSPTTTGDLDPATTGAPAPELTASWKGVTEDTISIAATILDFDALVASGLQDFGWGDQRLIWEFYLDRLNEGGGVAGRQVDAVLDFYNPALAVEAEASCLRMTQDREVFAVLGAFVGPAETATRCLTDQEDLVVLGGTMSVEQQENTKGTWLISGAADSRRIPTFFELLDQAGYIDGQRVAVVYGEENEQDTLEVVLPLLEERGLEVVVTAKNTAPTEDVLAEDRFWDLTAEQIRTEEAEVIVINGDTTGAIRGIANNDLEQEMWVVTSAQLVNLGTTVDRADADGALTLGEATAEEVWTEPQMAACVKEFTDAHPEVDVLGPLEVAEGDERWDTALANACRVIALFELAMNAAGPDLTPETVLAAAEALGEVELPGYFYASFGPDKPDANDGFRLSEWDHTAGENGSLVPVTELLDSTS